MPSSIKVGDTVYTVSWYGSDYGTIHKRICTGYREINGYPEWHTDEDYGNTPEYLQWMKSDEVFATEKAARKAFLEFAIDYGKACIQHWEHEVATAQKNLADEQKKVKEFELEYASFKN